MCVGASPRYGNFGPRPLCEIRVVTAQLSLRLSCAHVQIWSLFELKFCAEAGGAMAKCDVCAAAAGLQLCFQLAPPVFTRSQSSLQPAPLHFTQGRACTFTQNSPNCSCRNSANCVVHSIQHATNTTCHLNCRRPTHMSYNTQVNYSATLGHTHAHRHLLNDLLADPFADSGGRPAGTDATACASASPLRCTSLG